METGRTEPGGEVMSLLREYIRELLKEGAKGVSALVEKDTYITIDKEGLTDFNVYYSDEKGNPKDSRIHDAWGEVTIMHPDKGTGPCGEALNVVFAGTASGWGPMLYDVAMEIATVLGGGLTSSRNMVSSKAKPVWDFYQDRRSDVKKDQLDINKGESEHYAVKQLTPNNPKDDCNQEASIKWAHGEDYGAWEKRDVKSLYGKMQQMSDEEKADLPWDEQSESKGYQKAPDILKFLGDQGLFHFPQLGYDAIKYHTKKLPPLPPMDDEMEKARAQFRSQTTLSERKLKVKIK